VVRGGQLAAGGAFPRPSAKLLPGADRIWFTATRLFDEEGRFRLRTLSLPQVVPEDSL